MTPALYAAQRERALENRKREDAPFRICRRVRFIKSNEIADWDKADECAECREPVVYDSRDSEGLPHICWPCAYLHRLSFLKPDSPIEQLDADLSSLGDEDIQKRMAQTMSQARHGENVNKPSAPAPDHGLDKSNRGKSGYLDV